ncbi:hypothetical protein B484DRAFT_421873, partial [Ochromonadaceae sp. CCMP2298]
MLTLRVLALQWIAFVALLSNANKIQDYEPYTALQRDKLVALFPFDADSANLVPLENDDVAYRLIADTSSAKRSQDAVQGRSIYLGAVSVPLSISPTTFPLLTLGAWVKPSDSDRRASDPRVLFSNSVGGCARGVVLTDHWQICGDSTSGLEIRNRWTFVAVVYDHLAATATLYVDGATHTTNSTAAAQGDLLLGGDGFAGLVDNLFMYRAALSTAQLDLLRLAPKATYLPIAGNAGSALALSGGLGVVVPPHSQLSSFSQMSLTLWVRVAHLRAGFELPLVWKQAEYSLSLLDDPERGVRRVKLQLGGGSGRDRVGSDWESSWVADLAPIDANWMHIGLTWTGTQARLYLNGSLVGTNTSTARTIADTFSPLMLGRGPLTPPDAFTALLDSVSVWNTTLSPAFLSTYLLPVGGGAGGLAAHFDFNENYGVTTTSSVNNIQGTWEPLTRTSTSAGAGARVDAATAHWAVSGVPFDYSVTTAEDVPVLVLLNGTDPLGAELIYSLSALPHGTLYAPLHTAPGLKFPALGEPLALSQPFAHPWVVFVPGSNFVGVDSFSFSVTTSDDRTVAAGAGSEGGSASVSITVTSVVDPFQLGVTDGVITLEPFQIVDLDAWETGDQLSVLVQLEGAEGAGGAGAGETLSLASTQGLYFPNPQDRDVAFTASVDAASDAVSMINLTLHKELVTRSLSLTLTANDSVTGDKTADPKGDSLTIPMHVSFSSVPQIVSAEPHILSPGTRSVDIGGQFGLDATTCTVGGASYVLQRLSDTLLRCPLVAALGEFELRVVTTAGVASNALKLRVLPPLVPTSLTPGAGSVRGSWVEVAVQAEAPVYCAVGTSTSLAEVVDLSTVRCRTPPGQGRVKLGLFYSLQEAAAFTASTSTTTSTSAGLDFTYLADISGLWVDPAVVAPIAQLLTLHGSFLGGEICRVGGITSPLEVLSAAVGQCWVSDAALKGGEVTLELALNGVDFQAAAVLYVEAAPALQALSPRFVASGRSAVLTLTGVNFDAALNLTCIFNATEAGEGAGVVRVPATVLSTALLACTAPAFSGGLVSVQLGVGEVEVGGLLLQVYSPPVVLSAAPAYALLGAEAVVHIRGAGFTPGIAFCGWSGVSSESSGGAGGVVGERLSSSLTVLSDDSAYCAAPDLPLGTYDLTLETEEDGVGVGVGVGALLSFRVIPAPSVHTISPALGPVAGGTVVVLTGTFDEVEGGVFCSFGGAFVPAALTNATLSCTAPPFIDQARGGLVPVWVVYGAGEAEGAEEIVTFGYYTAPQVRSISPASGGAQLVTVTGSGFQDLGGAGEGVCRFGSTTVAATVLSATELICTAPGDPEGSGGFGPVGVSVSLNGQQFTPSV